MLKQMLLTPPRLLDVMLGFGYICISLIIYLTSYYIYTPNDPKIQHFHASLISYGCCQGLIGFFAGLCLARITQVEKSTDAQSAEDEEQAMLMVIENV